MFEELWDVLEVETDVSNVDVVEFLRMLGPVILDIRDLEIEVW